MNLNQRLNGYDTEGPTHTCLIDTTDSMLGRAEAMTLLIQNEFSGNRTLNDDVIFQSLESLRLELQDIKAVTKHYHEAQKQGE